MSPIMRPTVMSRAMRLGARGLGRVPARLRRRLVGTPVEVDGQRLDPDVQLVLAVLNATGDTFETKPLDESRDELDQEAWAFGVFPKLALVEDLLLDVGDHRVPVRRYRRDGPQGTTPAPGTVLYFHGGGWVLGGLLSADSVCRLIARRTGLEVVSVDYRLAPEHPFPAAADDAVAVFRHLRDHPELLHAAPGRIAVAGESAGGNLTCVVAQQCARDSAGGPVFACPIFPVTDLSVKRPSYELFGEGYFLSEVQMDWYRERYLSTDAEEAARLAQDPRVSPILTEDLTGLCPHHVVVAGFDVLRDEGLEYADRLRAAAVPTQVTLHEGFIHAFVNAGALGEVIVDKVHAVADSLLEGISG